MTRRLLLAPVLAAAMLLGAGSASAPRTAPAAPAACTISLVSGAHQAGPAGGLLPRPVAVRQVCGGHPSDTSPYVEAERAGKVLFSEGALEIATGGTLTWPSMIVPSTPGPWVLVIAPLHGGRGVMVPEAATRPAPPLVHWYRGYTSQGGRVAKGLRGVTAAAGTIVVPRVTGTTDLWVGVNGDPGRLVQAGISIDANSFQDYAWVATVGPGAGHPHPAPAWARVRPGQHLRISIAWTGGTHWSVMVHDLSSGWTWTPAVRPVAAPGWLAEGTWDLEWGPVRFIHGGTRFWWPTITWEGHHQRATGPGEGENVGPGCIQLANQLLPHQPFLFRNCPTTQQR